MAVSGATAKRRRGLVNLILGIGMALPAVGIPLAQGAVVAHASSPCILQAVGGGAQDTLGLANDGSIWTWGTDPFGVLGNGQVNGGAAFAPSQISGVGTSTAIAAGSYHDLALKNNGTVFAWGYNAFGQLGNGGNADNNSTPGQVSGLSSVTAVAAGGYHSLAIKSDGTLWAWGDNANGQLGNGTTTNALTPVQVPGMTGVTAIAAGIASSYAVKSDGTLWTWGFNMWGDLGDGTTTERHSPAQVLTGVSAVASEGDGHHALALKSGNVWSWGLNNSGQLGNGTTTNSSTPAQISGLSGITSIATGSGFSLAVANDGTAWAWGLNSSGQLGDGTTTNHLTPEHQGTLSSLYTVSAGDTSSYALTTTLALYVWGDDSAGQLNGSSGSSSPNPFRENLCDFSISNSGPITVDQSQSGTSTISTSVLRGNAVNVTLTASGLPAGASASFSTNPVTAGGQSTMTISTAWTTPPGVYPITVSGAGDNSVTHTTQLNLTVVANDFSLSAGPSPQSVGQGFSGNYSVSTTLTSGLAQSINLSVSGFPANTTSSFSLNPISAGQGSNLSFTLDAAAPIGSYPLTITAAGTSITHTTSVTLNVVANDFSLSASPASLSIDQGQSGTTTIGSTLTSGGAQSISLSASGLPTGVTASFSPATINAGGSSTMTLTVAASAPATSATVTVTGTGTFATHTTTVSLGVVANDFSISAPSSVSANQGQSATAHITTTVTSGLAQALSLSASGLPSGATASFNPSGINSGQATDLTILTGVTTPPGTYSVVVTATGTYATHIATISLTVVADDFSLSANPSSLTVGQGFGGSSTISDTLVSGAAQNVTMSASGLPAGVTASFSDNPITAGGHSTLTLATPASTPVGTYLITVTGTAASTSHSVTVTLNVVANDFAMSASPSAITVDQSRGASSTISTVVTSGGTQSVNLSVSGLPAGAGAVFSPAAVNAGGSSTLSLSTAFTTPPGTYTLTVTGTGASATHSVTISLTVVADDFSIASNPAGLTVGQGYSGTTTISTAVTGGVTQSIVLSAGGLPAGASATFGTGTINAGQSTSLTLAAGPGTPTGTYTITVTGTGQATTHTTTVTLTVVLDDFSISVAPSSISLYQGQSGTVSVATAITSGGSQGVTLSAAGLPSDTTAAFSPNPISSGGGSTLTIAVGAGAAARSYTVNVTGTGTFVTHSVQLTLVVLQVPSNACHAGTPVVDGYVQNTYVRVREYMPNLTTLLVCVRIQNDQLVAGELLTLQVPSGVGGLPLPDNSSGACAGTPGDQDNPIINTGVGPENVLLETATDPAGGATWVCFTAGGPVNLAERVIVPGGVVSLTPDPPGLFLNNPTPPWPVSGPDAPSSQCQANGGTRLLALVTATGGEWLYTMPTSSGGTTVCERVQAVPGAGAGAALTLDTSQLGLVTVGSAAGGSATCPTRVITNASPVELAVWTSAPGNVPASICLQVAGGSWVSLTSAAPLSVAVDKVL